MSLFGLNTGYSLKDLLENPILQNPPQLNKDGDNKLKEKGALSPPAFDPTSAFLGPNLWNTNQYSDGDISLEYMDLDEFLSENGIPVDISESSNGSSKDLLSLQIPSPQKSDAGSTPQSPVSETTVCTNDLAPSPKSVEVEVIQRPGGSSPLLKIDFEIEEGEQALVNVPGEETFDPKARKFSEDELKPQPMIKKSRKVFVPDEQKDDKYWSRRKKNNVAAKRSRDARRVKENQIAMRACYLEKCNQTLTEELKKVKKENAELRKSLEEYEKKLKLKV